MPDHRRSPRESFPRCWWQQHVSAPIDRVYVSLDEHEQERDPRS